VGRYNNEVGGENVSGDSERTRFLDTVADDRWRLTSWYAFFLVSRFTLIGLLLTSAGIKFHYPIRDLLKSELVNYVSLTLPGSPEPLLPLCIAYSAQPKHSAANVVSGRNITIDELMTQYFEGIETQYPSIVANVVKTAGKLQPLRGNRDGESCRICGLPGDGAGEDMTLSALTLNARVSGGGKLEKGSQMCYGCARSTHGAAPYDWPLEP
jgi:cytoplasmic tRNA 2-thiolation protein 2